MSDEWRKLEIGEIVKEGDYWTIKDGELKFEDYYLTVHTELDRYVVTDDCWGYYYRRVDTTRPDYEERKLEPEL